MASNWANDLETYESQRERVLAQLRADRAAGHGTCGNVLLGLRIPRYGARLWELRHVGGFGIRTVSRCRMHLTHTGAVHEYQLVFDPATDSMELFPGGR